MSRAEVRNRRRNLVLPKGGVQTYTTQACASGNSDAPALMASDFSGTAISYEFTTAADVIERFARIMTDIIVGYNTLTFSGKWFALLPKGKSPAHPMAVVDMAVAGGVNSNISFGSAREYPDAHIYRADGDNARRSVEV